MVVRSSSAYIQGAALVDVDNGASCKIISMYLSTYSEERIMAELGCGDAFRATPNDPRMCRCGVHQSEHLWCENFQPHPEVPNDCKHCGFPKGSSVHRKVR